MHSNNLTLYLHLLHFGSHLLQGFFVFFLLCIAMWWSFESQLMMARNLTYLQLPCFLRVWLIQHLFLFCLLFVFLSLLCSLSYITMPLTHIRTGTHPHMSTHTSCLWECRSFSKLCVTFNRPFCTFSLPYKSGLMTQ